MTPLLALGHTVLPNASYLYYFVTVHGYIVCPGTTWRGVSIGDPAMALLGRYLIMLHSLKLACEEGIGWAFTITAGF